MSFDYFFDTVKDNQYIYKDPKLDNKLIEKELSITKGNKTDFVLDLSKNLDIIRSIQLNCSAHIKIVGAENSVTYLDTWVDKDKNIDFPSILSSDKLYLQLFNISCSNDKITLMMSGCIFPSDIKNKLADTCILACFDHDNTKIPVQYVIAKDTYEKHVCCGYFD